MVLEGASRSEAAASNGMDVQTLRDWVLRYNADGVAGLRDRGGQGRRPVLSQEQLAALKAAVIEGPDAARDGVARYLLDVGGFACLVVGVYRLAQYRLSLSERKSEKP